MSENGNNTNFTTISKNELSKWSFRDLIGIGMISLSVGLLIAISIISFRIVSKLDSNAEKFKDIQELFGILLPLIGTWVGTVLAYYFSKDNFVAANQSVRDLVKHITSTEEKLQELMVSDVMRKPENFPYFLVDDFEAFEQCKIQELINYMIDHKADRLPILKKGTLSFVFLLYQTTLEKFQIDYVKLKIHLKDNITTTKLDDLTIKDMFDSDFQLMKDIQRLIKDKKFLPVTATLEEVRQLMLDNDICQDTFITKTGNKDEKVEGWITNNLIIEKTELFNKAGK
jgi:hypothetical protein